MKIGPLENTPPVAPVAGERPGPAARPGGVPSEQPSAQVELSAAAALPSPEGGDVDAQKVARIAQAIRDGTFQVNAEAIADKLIANAQELLGRSSH